MTIAAASWLHFGAAAVCLGWVALILVAGRGWQALPPALTAAAAAAWALAVGWQPQAPLAGLAGGLEVGRSAIWLGVLLLLAHRVSGAASRRLAWGFGLAGAAVTALALAALLPGAAALPTLGSPALLARLGLALLVLLVAENLYRNAPEAARWHVVLPCITLGGLSAFDVLLHADAALSRGYAPALLDARAALTALAMPLLAIAAVRDRRWRRDPPVSRDVVFHAATLVIGGTFLVGVGAAGEALRHLGADWGRAAEASLLAGAVMMVAVAASARSMRSRLRRRIVDHFFAARFDYRREWLRSAATLAAQDADAQQRAIEVIANPVDSPAGLLLLREPGEPELRWAGSWNLPVADLVLPADHPLLAALANGRIATEIPPELVALHGPLWLAVPLPHPRDGLVGVVLLAPPRAAFALDAEVFDLLRTLGQEVAMFLAERRAAERLHDQRRLQDYAQRFAFVAHDVKTVASQLTMLLANAEHHMADREFQQDLLLTVAAAASRINLLVARLRQPDYDAAPEMATQTATPLTRLREIARGLPHRVDIRDEDAAACRAAIAPDSFDAAVRHLLDNAAEASPAGAAVQVRLRRDGPSLILDITDQGPGMTPEFIRDRLFRPLVSGRINGNGIGAWQARDLLRGAGGDLAVLSRPGVGTTMRLTLPCLVTA